MQKPINAAADGTIFINCMRPVGKLLHAMKSAPPAIKVALGVAVAFAAVAGIGIYIYKRALARS